MTEEYAKKNHKHKGVTDSPRIDCKDLDNLPLPIEFGGTGSTTATDAFDALSPLTTKGDSLTHDGSASVREAVGANGKILIADSNQTTGRQWVYPSFPQIISVNAEPPVALQLTSSTNDGDTIFATYSVSTTVHVSRYTRDASGQYYNTHNASLTNATDNTKGVGIALVGSYVYIIHRGSASGNTECRRFLAADLTSETTITFSVAPSSNGPHTSAFSDGTNLYFFDATSGDHFKYTISGTTITKSSQIDFNDSSRCWCDGTHVYFFNGGDVKKLDLTGASVSTNARNLTSPFNSDANGGIVYNNSLLIYVGQFGGIDSNTAFDHSAIYLIPLLKP